MPRTPDSVLRVDLSTHGVHREPVPAGWRRRFIGGKGLGARYLYEELDAGTDPLGPDNALLFAVGPLTGLLPGESRYAAITKSPLTGTFLDSYGGGSFPQHLAGALDGALALCVTGQANDPVRIVVEDGDARVEPADEWGNDVVETCRSYDTSVACIGPAGEHEVAFATIGSDEAEHHAGRGGAGAVMGSKRLKTVVARGDPPQGLEDLRERAAKRFAESPTGRWQRASGTVETVEFASETDVLAARGYGDHGFGNVDGIGVDAARERAVGRERPGDSVPGDFRVETDAGESVPRGATAMSLGAGLDITDFDAVAVLGERCNRLGIDLISAGTAVAWAARAAEAGVIEHDIAFGDPEGAGRLVHEIAHRESSLGDRLADGVSSAAERLGGESLVPAVKDMALPAYDPRGAASMALAYATSDRGACHRRARPVEQEAFDGPWSPGRAAQAVASAQDTRAARWSLVADDFAGEALEDAGASWLAALDYPYDDLEVIGERVWNLTRLFNVREGFRRGDDTMPPVIDRGALSTSLDELLDAYYRHRGWSADGIPTRTTLDRLGLLQVVDDETPVKQR